MARGTFKAPVTPPFFYKVNVAGVSGRLVLCGMDTPSEPEDSAGSHRLLRMAVIAAGIVMLVTIAGVGALWLFLKLRSGGPAAEATHVVASRPAPAVARWGYPLRDPNAKKNEIDLSEHYNFLLHNNWHGGQGNNLAELPTGLQMLDGTEFDVRGLIQVARQS